MSVAAMTMDDQRPLMSNYDKMPKQYEQNLHAAAGGSGGSGAPSGPASPTPSGSEEPTSQHHQYHQHQHHHHHHSHHQQQFHHRHQQHAPPPLMAEQQPQLSLPASSSQELLPPTIVEAVAAAAQRQRQLEDEIESLKLEQTRLAQQSSDAQRREKILMRRLANKEQEFQDYVSQIAEYKAAQAPSALALRSALLDPAVNLLFEKLKKELKATKAKLEETQNELSAWKFTPDSNTGKCLMAKCRLLYQENEELGKMTSNGRLAKLETELAMQKSFSEEVKKSQSELDDFLQELDEDVEGMQSTILFLQQELKTTRDRIQLLEKENHQLKNGPSDLVKEAELATNNSSPSQQPLLNGQVTVDSALSTTAGINNTLTTSYAQNNQQAQPSAAQQLIIPPTNNEIKLETPSSAATTTPLATIDENSCLKTTAINATTTATVPVNELYNGNDEAQTAALPPVDDGSNGSNSNNSAAGKLRTPASRKRNYESIDSNEIITSAATPVVAQPLAVAALPTHVVVSAPRTLPPKKSKLRVSARSVELNETPDFVPVVGGTGIMAAVDPLAFVDNAVVGMANEEVASSVVPVEEAAAVDVSVTTGGSAVAQRIMTRRRSVRPQQNGSGDSNH